MLFAFLPAALGRVLFLALHLSPSRFPQPLSSRQEAAAFAAMAHGDAAARDRLIRHNLRLVAHIAKKYYAADTPEDLISTGSIGLIKAVNTFDPARGIKFSTYASRCIENAILTQRNKRWLRLVCSSTMYYCCAFRCFTAASTSSSFCSVAQGSFWMDFSACSDWNFASSCPSSRCVRFDFGKIRNTSMAALLSRTFSALIYA